MASTRVTISLPDDLAARLKAEVGERSVSAYVADLIKGDLDDAQLAHRWDEYLDDIGVTADDIATADRVLDELLAPRATDAA